MSGWFELLSQSKARVVLSTSAWCSLVFGWVGLAIAESAENSPRVVSVASAPDRPWSKKETRTLEDLPKIPFDPEGSRFGGVPGKFGKGTGFFRVINPEGRWWLVDPDGHLFIHRGVTSVRQTKTDAARKKLKESFGTPMDWGKSTGVFLKESGFNGLGPWSDEVALQPTKAGLVYTKLWNFMSTYGRKRGGVHQKSGHTGYAGDCPFIFDPEFVVHCDKLARELVATKDDPWLLGHFTDNELPWSIDMLDRYLDLPKDEAGYLAASKWLQERRGGKAKSSKISREEREAFLAFAVDTYFSIVSKAIRRYDPNHLILGSRFHGRALSIPQLFEAAGRHVDVISVNYYHAWTPDKDRMESWAKSAGKPILISEWYAKAEDSGMTNGGGVGWLVKTQADRAAFYQNFTLGLIESRTCVGWHWFRYSDNDPDQKGTDPSNRDSNKGIVTSHYEPYDVLLDAMKEVNFRTYGIVRHFDDPEAGSSSKVSPSSR